MVRGGKHSSRRSLLSPCEDRGKRRWKKNVASVAEGKIVDVLGFAAGRKPDKIHFSLSFSVSLYIGVSSIRDLGGKIASCQQFFRSFCLWKASWKKINLYSLQLLFYAFLRWANRNFFMCLKKLCSWMDLQYVRGSWSNIQFYSIWSD